MTNWINLIKTNLISLTETKKEVNKNLIYPAIQELREQMLEEKILIIVMSMMKQILLNQHQMY